MGVGHNVQKVICPHPPTYPSIPHTHTHTHSTLPPVSLSLVYSGRREVVEGVYTAGIEYEHRREPSQVTLTPPCIPLLYAPHGMRSASSIKVDYNLAVTHESLACTPRVCDILLLWILWLLIMDCTVAARDLSWRRFPWCIHDWHDVLRQYSDLRNEDTQCSSFNFMIWGKMIQVRLRTIIFRDMFLKILYSYVT